MSDRNILFPGASMRPFRNSLPAGVEGVATPSALDPSSVQFRVARSGSGQLRSKLFSDANPGMTSSIERQRRCQFLTRPARRGAAIFARRSYRTARPAIVFPDDTIGSFLWRGFSPSTGTVLCPLPFAEFWLPPLQLSYGNSKRVQLVRVTHKHVLRSRRTEDSIEQRTRPSELRPIVPDDR